MSELKAIRLAKISYNVGMEHIVAELKKNGLTVENNPTAKLSPDMVLILEKAFNADKAIKAEADGSKVLEKIKKETLELKEEIPVAPKRKVEEKEVLIKSNKVIAPVEEVVTPTPPAQTTTRSQGRNGIPKIGRPENYWEVGFNETEKNR